MDSSGRTPRSDLVILTLRDSRLDVLLVERGIEPSGAPWRSPANS